MSILNDIIDVKIWEAFFTYKSENESFTKEEAKAIRTFIDEKRFEYYAEQIKNNAFPTEFPTKKIVNKEGTEKKRIVYSYAKEDNIIFKFIAYNLYQYDDQFSRNCYAFRRGYGVKDAVRRFKGNPEFAEKYCYKADISNYFNSIDVERLLEKMEFIKKDDEILYNLFEKCLKEERVYIGTELIVEQHGAMAGTPCSPFFANIYLAELDTYFETLHVPYFRYSDDILIFADSEEELQQLIAVFLQKIKEHHLEINESKVTITKPGEPFEFLGFSYQNGVIDLSYNTKRKIKSKIKRKAEALRRWQRKKGVTSDKAAIGFINTMNKKFYGGTKREWHQDDFTWCRWFFPNITTDVSLKEIDAYMQQYIRYIITGRHYKGNYRISYEQLKNWGYRSLVHEYYEPRDKWS